MSKKGKERLKRVEVQPEAVWICSTCKSEQSEMWDCVEYEAKRTRDGMAYDTRCWKCAQRTRLVF